MPFSLPFSGAGNMTVDIKNAIEMVQLWQKGLRGTAEIKVRSLELQWESCI